MPKRKPKSAIVSPVSKTPKTEITPSPAKVSKARVEPFALTLRPSWRVAVLEMADPYGWHKMDSSQVTAVLARLKSFESMAWNEILVRDRHENHRITVSALSRAARDRLVEIKQDDLDELVSLRVTGERRIWGIWDGDGSLRLLWWDPHHLVCPSHKKHT